MKNKIGPEGFLLLPQYLENIIKLKIMRSPICQEQIILIKELWLKRPVEREG